MINLYMDGGSANVQNILTFEDRYQNVSVHKLLTNFRSTEDIVNVSNSFIKRKYLFRD